MTSPVVALMAHILELYDEISDVSAPGPELTRADFFISMNDIHPEITAEEASAAWAIELARKAKR